MVGGSELLQPHLRCAHSREQLGKEGARAFHGRSNLGPPLQYGPQEAEERLGVRRRQERRLWRWNQVHRVGRKPDVEGAPFLAAKQVRARHQLI